MKKWIIIAQLVVLILSGCSSTNVIREQASVKGIKLKMTEVAKDGEYDLYPDERFRKVDANSILRLKFETPMKPENVEGSPRWNQLSGILHQLNKTALEHRKLATKATELMKKDSRLDSVFIAEAATISQKAIEILTSLTKRNTITQSAILEPDELTELMKKRKNDPYKALSEILNKEKDKLHRSAVNFARNIEQYEVILRAYLNPKGGQRQALHIPGYDNLPQGDFNTLDPLAMLPTPQESKRLMAELKAARQVSATIKEIRDKGKEIQKNINEILSDFKKSIIKLASGIQDDLLNILPGNWKEITSEPFITKISQIQTTNNESKNLSEVLKELSVDIIAFKRIQSKIEFISRTLSDLKKPNEELFSRLDETLASIVDLKDEISKIVSRLTKWDTNITTISRTIPIVLQTSIGEIIKANLQKFNDATITDLKKAKQIFATILPNTSTTISFISDFYKDSKGMLELDNQKQQYIPQPIDDLKIAELDLRYSGIAVGDQVSITFDLQQKNNSQEKNTLRPPSVTYTAEATLAGWHRRFDSNVILSRSLSSGVNNEFRPNTSISLEWHKFVRPGSDWFWNELDFGFGFHATFLDQVANENIEMGGGINVSVLDGLVRSGIGYNLSADKENGYWFVGFGLFSLLGKIGEVGEQVF